MSKVKLMFIGITSSCYSVVVMGQEDSTQAPVLTGAINSEINYGPNCLDNGQTTWDFPHFKVDAILNMGKDWSVTASFEYERSYADGIWHNNFEDNFSTNALYVSKHFSDALQVKAGIVDVPVGLTNHGGPAFTIYDPECESDLLPITWHETGVALFGGVGKWDYSVSALSYISSPLNNAEMLGMAARVDFHIAAPLRIGLSGYLGKSCHGMINRCAPDFFDCSSLHYITCDMDYAANGLFVDGSAIYCSEGNSRSVGLEVGYDFLSLNKLLNGTVQLLPFVRYDCVCGEDIDTKNKFTIGVNISPVHNLVFKAEYGARHYASSATERLLNFSLGYTVDL